MENTAVVRARVSPKVKEEAVAVLSNLGLNLSDVIRMVVTKIAMDKSLPFESEIPNEVTAKVIRDADKGKNLHRAKNVSDLFKQLGL